MTVYTNQDAHNDITEQFTQFKRIQTGRSMRMMFSNRLTEWYIATNGYNPPGIVLERLGTLILLDEISDGNPHKVAHTDFPILSDQQVERREDRERKAGVVEYGNERCVGRKKTHFTDDYGAPQVRNSKVYAKL